ncbi:hypothetical protein TNCV_1420201 [Trichonephila clavipes]|nr:hypothetical protein TNCV_1420201 [Trichonephila clavipes]
MDIGNGRIKLMNLHNLSPCQQTSVRSQKASTNWCKKFSQTLHKKLQKPSVAQYACFISSQSIDVNTINFTIQHGIPSEKRQHISPSILWRIKMRLSTIN